MLPALPDDVWIQIAAEAMHPWRVLVTEDVTSLLNQRYTSLAIAKGGEPLAFVFAKAVVFVRWIGLHSVSRTTMQQRARLADYYSVRLELLKDLEMQKQAAENPLAFTNAQKDLTRAISKEALQNEIETIETELKERLTFPFGEAELSLASHCFVALRRPMEIHLNTYGGIRVRLMAMNKTGSN